MAARPRAHALAAGPTLLTLELPSVLRTRRRSHVKSEGEPQALSLPKSLASGMDRHSGQRLHVQDLVLPTSQQARPLLPPARLSSLALSLGVGTPKDLLLLSTSISSAQGNHPKPWGYAGCSLCHAAWDQSHLAPALNTRQFSHPLQAPLGLTLYPPAAPGTVGVTQTSPALLQLLLTEVL